MVWRRYIFPLCRGITLFCEILRNLVPNFFAINEDCGPTLYKRIQGCFSNTYFASIEWANKTDGNETLLHSVSFYWIVDILSLTTCFWRLKFCNAYFNIGWNYGFTYRDKKNKDMMALIKFYSHKSLVPSPTAQWL